MKNVHSAFPESGAAIVAGRPHAVYQPDVVSHQPGHRRIPNSQPSDNLEPTRKLPKCYQMLPSFGSISKLRVATNSGEDAIRVAKMSLKTCKKLPNATKRLIERFGATRGRARETRAEPGVPAMVSAVLLTERPVWKTDGQSEDSSPLFAA